MNHQHTYKPRRLGAVLVALAAVSMLSSTTTAVAKKAVAKPKPKAKTTTKAPTTTAAPATTAAPTTVAPTTTVAAATLVEGCAKGWTDPVSISGTRQIARCDKGFPAPKPLKEKTKIKVSSAFRLEFNSPFLLADSLGEFAKENIEIEFVSLSLANSIPQLAEGRLDVGTGGFEVALFNAGAQNLPVRAVLGNYFPPKASNYKVPQTGLWCRRDSFANPPAPDFRNTEQMKWATSVGKGSVGIYYAAAELVRRFPDFKIKNVEIVVVPSGDAVTALRNKAIDCSILLDPFWLQVANDPQFVMVSTQTPGEPLGVYVYGKRMLENPEIGDAFARAFIRTVNTYYSGDYHEDPAVLAAIAKATNLQTASLKAVDSLSMDWELRAGTTSRVQQLFIDLGVITTYSTPVSEDKIVDRSFYERAVGKRK